MILAIILLTTFVSLFIRECKLDNIRYQEQERLGNEHMLREMEKYLKEQFEKEKSLK